MGLILDACGEINIVGISAVAVVAGNQSPQSRDFNWMTGGIPQRAKKEALLDGLALRSSWEFMFNWGGGLKYLVADQFALTFDVRDRVSRVPSYGIPDSARIINGQFQPGMATHGVLNNWQFNLGFTYQWDE